MPRASLNLDEYSDRELVHLVADLGDDDGWVTVDGFRKKVGLAPEHAQSVVTRFAWMRRYGIMERTMKGERKWRLTLAGREMVQSSTISAARLGVLNGMKDAELVWASHTLAGVFQRAKPEHAVMTRREWQREIQRRGRA